MAKHPTKENNRRRPVVADSKPVAAAEPYKVGPGRPPKEYQYKPGQSGNPKGAKMKQPSMRSDLGASLERALDEKLSFRQGERERTMTKAEMGIAQLVNQYAKGDRHARRDLIDIAGRLGVDLTRGRHQAIETALSATHEQILESYVSRCTGLTASLTSPPVFAPPDLLDDDDVGDH
jgi:hypothetical protein